MLRNLYVEYQSRQTNLKETIYQPFGAGIIFLNFNTLVYKMWINPEPKYVRIMKQTAFWREKNGEYIPCLKYSVPVFVE